jgi:hypothetical protein
MERYYTKKLLVGRLNAPQDVLLRSAFMDGSLDWFEIVDDPSATNRPSQWRYNSEQLRIE